MTDEQLPISKARESLLRELRDSGESLDELLERAGRLFEADVVVPYEGEWTDSIEDIDQ